ncbi:hypothetical protein J6S88_04515 [bacterium]|nr:hypothetical protein [bacterium]
MIRATENNVYMSSSAVTRSKVTFGRDRASSGTVFNAEMAETTAGGVGAAGLLYLVQWGIEKLSKICSYALMAGKEFTSGKNVEKIAKAMKKDNGLETEIYFVDNANKGILKHRIPQLEKDIDIVAAGKNAFFANSVDIAVAPKSKPSLILHELGHSINFNKKGIMYVLQKLRVVGMYAPMTLAVLNTFAGARRDGQENFIERNAGKLGFCAMLPTIIEEGVASIHGIKAARLKLGKAAKLGALKRNYFFAWMTYVLGGLGVAVASKLAIRNE